MDADLAGSLGQTLPEGILISDLHPDSPFGAAGIAVGDVITHVDGLPVNTPSEMVFRMSVAGIGAQARITRLHGGARDEVTVNLIAAPDAPPAEPLQLDEATILPGVRLARANPAVIAAFGLPLNAQGVVVTETGRVGQRAGLQPGDVLVAVNERPVDSTRAARAALTDPGRRVQLDLVRRGQPVRLRFRL